MSLRTIQRTSTRWPMLCFLFSAAKNTDVFLINVSNFIFQNDKSPGRSASRSSNISKVGELYSLSYLFINLHILWVQVNIFSHLTCYCYLWAIHKYDLLMVLNILRVYCDWFHTAKWVKLFFLFSAVCKR